MYLATMGAGSYASGPGSGDDDFDDHVEDSVEVEDRDLDLVDDNHGSDSDIDDIQESYSDTSEGDEDNNDLSDGSNSGSSSDESHASGSDSGSSNSSDSDSGDSSGSNSGSAGNSGSNHGSDDSGSNSGSSGQSVQASQGADAIHTSNDALIVDRDEDGREYVRGEVLLIGAARHVEAARNAGFRLISAATLTSLGGELARLRIPDGMTLEQAIAGLGQLAPDALVTANNVYRHSQSFASAAQGAIEPRRRPLQGTVGVIDTGVDPAMLPTPDALLSQRAFSGARPVPHQHGSIVAALVVQHGARVHVADVFGHSADGALAAAADSIAAALDWMIANNVAVINVSIEGPNNSVLRELVLRAARRGHVIVAAAGNGGPMAHPAYPGAFEGAIAVTAIDVDGHPYLRANRGPYIAFAAPGVDVALEAGDSRLIVSGTSFAAPVVAAAIAAHMGAPSPDQARQALATLREHVIDLGAPGRDPVFGWGAVQQ